MRIRFNDTDIQEITYFDFTPSQKADGSEKALTLFTVDAGQTQGDYIADVIIDHFASYDDAKAYCKSVADNMLVHGYYDIRKDVENGIINLW